MTTMDGEYTYWVRFNYKNITHQWFETDEEGYKLYAQAPLLWEIKTVWQSSQDLKNVHDVPRRVATGPGTTWPVTVMVVLIALVVSIISILKYH